MRLTINKTLSPRDIQYVVALVSHGLISNYKLKAV